MARKHYTHSDETFKAVVDHEAAIAKEFGCDPTYIYGIKNRSQKDPFSPFRELYRATARGGGDTSPWRRDLDAIDASVNARNESPSDLTDLLCRKLRGDGVSSEDLAAAIRDGELDERECEQIIRDMTSVASLARLIKATATVRLGEIRENRHPLRAA
jgi:hypothetical protein